jgi:hypothetical protein
MKLLIFFIRYAANPLRLTLPKAPEMSILLELRFLQ